MNEANAFLISLVIGAISGLVVYLVALVLRRSVFYRQRVSVGPGVLDEARRSLIAGDRSSAVVLAMAAVESALLKNIRYSARHKPLPELLDEAIRERRVPADIREGVLELYQTRSRAVHGEPPGIDDVQHLILQTEQLLMRIAEIEPAERRGERPLHEIENFAREVKYRIDRDFFDATNVGVSSEQRIADAVGARISNLSQSEVDAVINQLRAIVAEQLSKGSSLAFVKPAGAGRWDLTVYELESLKDLDLNEGAASIDLLLN